MNTLIRHIEYLISRHDCVIIPGFGAILATYVSARYDAETNRYIAPHRQLAFNSTLKHNDGLLAASIQQAEGISYENALCKIQTAVDALRMCLHNNGELSLGAIGTIVVEDAGSTQYLKEAKSECLGIQSFWLPEIQTGNAVKTQPIIVDAPIEKKAFPRLKRVIRGAASIALLLGIGFVASTPLTVDNAITLASLAPEISHVTTADIIPAKEESDVLTIIAPRHIEEAVPTTVKEAVAADGPLYYVIVATFTTEAEAESYLSHHIGAGLKILDKGAYYKVYSSVHTDIKEAYRASASVSNVYPGAWVYKR